MNEFQLRDHLNNFNRPIKRARYLLQVQSSNSCTGTWVVERHLAWMLCETAFRAGVANHIRLLYFPNPDDEQVLFDSGNEEMVQQMAASLRFEAKMRKSRKLQQPLLAKV